MGMNVIPLKDITPEEPREMTLDLLKNMDPNDTRNEKSRGQVVVEVLYKPFKGDEIPPDMDGPNSVQKAPEGTPEGGGLLVVILHEAQDVEGKYHTNPSARILFRGEEKKTKVCPFNTLARKIRGNEFLALILWSAIQLRLNFGNDAADKEKQRPKMGRRVSIYAGGTTNG